VNTSKASTATPYVFPLVFSFGCHRLNRYILSRPRGRTASKTAKSVRSTEETREV
jgi:hypothetical protein